MKFNAKRVSLALCACLLSLSGPAAAQKKNADYQLRIHRTPSPIVIDGSAHEPAWESAEVAGDFWMVLPMDTSRAKVRTDVRMAYDDHNLYLSAICFHGDIPGPYIVESLRRDWAFGNGPPVPHEDYYLRAQPSFETSVGKHDWLTRHVFIGVGERRPDGNYVRYYALT